MPGLAGALLVCLALLVLSKRVRFPPIPFYIGAGLVLGEAGLGLVAADEISAFLARIGLLFLLFSMGLQLRPDQIRIRGSSFAAAGIIDCAVNIPLGFIGGLALGIPIYEALLIAAAFYISSSAMAVASLIENKKLFLAEAETVVWLMVFEDIVLVLFVALFSSTGQGAVSVFARTAVVVAACFLVVRYGRQALISLLSREDEVPLVFSFSAVIGAAWLAGMLGVPETLLVIALGSALSQTVPGVLEAQIRPFRDVFLIVFFVFFGITIDFAGIPPLPALVALAVLALLSKLLSGALIGRVVHRRAGSGVEIWSHTAARGEFSIALAAVFGSAAVSGTVAALVVITSLCGALLGKYGTALFPRALRNVSDSHRSGRP
ncbi:MAG: sodium:proton exchanger [Methanoculleus sp. SDB]|nr:MAG: sodium:proton exchanger [Methanoculleus sp. SDB]